MTHLATVAIAPATAPAARITAPDSRTVHHGPSQRSSACSAKRTPRAIRTVHIIGTNRHNSTAARANFSRSGGLNVLLWSPSIAWRRSFTGGLPSQEVPAFDFLGAADSTATRPFFGTERPGAVIPELPRKARLPTFAPATCNQPPPSSY